LIIAEQTAEKAADLAQQLLAYSGQGKFIVTRFDLSVLIQNMLRLLQTSIPGTVQLKVDLKADLWIEADASQIQQVVMNLVINGAESMEPKGGVLRVSTAQVLKSPTQGDAGTRICMEVQDSGSGMSEATKSRIFDPFFTTKFTGRGLGLAAVSGIIRGHQGTMEVESAIGEGSTFRISFPATEAPAKGAERIEPVELLEEPISGTVLVVDDQPELRRLAQQILERFGYTVLLAGDGQQAVDLFRQKSDVVTAILLDMTMPVMGGVEAFGLLRAIRADVPIVVSTGFGEESTRELLGASTVVGFVQKPYTAARLCERIRTTTQVAQAVRESSAGRNANPMVLAK
jgi:CheY-like chemotaxis protein